MVKPPDSYYASQNQDLNVNAYTNNCRWVMKDVKPLKVENYISSSLNYLDKIEFQLFQVSDGESTRNVMTDWKTVSQELLKDKDFGDAFNEDAGWLANKVTELSSNNPDALQFAHNAYYYMRDNFNCSNYRTCYTKSSLQKVFINHSGNVAELNLLLTLMLRQKGILADPVLLSTKENGFSFANYPVLDKFDYVICRVKIGESTYYLDCSHSRLGFGLLQNNCYNGQAEIINATSPESIILSPDSIKEQKTILITISNTDDGKFSGTFVETPGMFESYNMRQSLLNTNVGDYGQLLKDHYPAEVSVSNLQVDSLKDYELPLAIKYDFSVAANPDGVLYFSPFTERDKKNPFDAATRTYPVEMPYRLQHVYILNMEVPKGYKVDEVPKSVRMKLGETDGLFEYIAVANNNHVQMRCTIILNRAIFDPSYYQTLRDFFAFIAKKESEQIVFKKS
jgi:hypothetical protein